jgi:hypothetical protein
MFVDLIVCLLCNHGVTMHDGSGCEDARCPCTATRSYIVQELTERAKVEISRTRLRAVRRKRHESSTKTGPSLVVVRESGSRTGKS